EGFTTVGGFRSNSFSINNETIDITNKDSSGVRELLSGGGIQSFSLSGSGVFMDDAAFALAEQVTRNKESRNWQVIVPGYGTYQGLYQITSLEFGGEHNGEMTYSLAMESAGIIAFVAP
ncbi:MAG: phage major tail protein, TP901-1 family, partial [Sphingomonadales bacterium]|nr:phage major tail protein, TP901-1 family [Sphingomonadales bacterium]